MDVIKAAANTAAYLGKTFPGSFADTIRKSQPKKEKDEVFADLHAHPYITDKKSLYSTLDIMVAHNLDELAITTHMKWKGIESDFWQVKNLIQEKGLAEKLCFEDQDLAFKLTHPESGKELTFVGAYETDVRVPGFSRDACIHMVALMPDKGFEQEVQHGMRLDKYLRLDQDCSAITIAAHPYTVQDPWLFGLIPFRLAKSYERKAIQDEVFPFVDSVDLVATNALWMTESNKLLQEDYPNKPLANSDAHSTGSYARKELGRAANIFQKEENGTGDAHREDLRTKIKTGWFKTYLAEMPVGRFARALVLHLPYKKLEK